MGEVPLYIEYFKFVWISYWLVVFQTGKEF